MNDHPLVAQRVSEAFYHDGAITGDGTDTGQLLPYVGDGIAARSLIHGIVASKPVKDRGGLLWPVAGRVLGRPLQLRHAFRQLPPKGTQAQPHMIVTLGQFAVPKRHPRGGARCIGDDQSILVDIHHAPGVIPQHEHIPDVRLKHKLLVERSQIRMSVRQYNLELPSVGDCSTVANGQ